jgi:hypothetical protein
MDTKQLLSELRAERDRITQAISAIESLSGTGTRTDGRSKAARAGRAAAAKSAPRRTMSPAARKRISEAAKKRWAERRKAAAKA